MAVRFVESSASGAELTVDKVNGMVTLTVPTRWKIGLTDGLLTILGLDDGLGGVWLDGGVYTGDRQINFAPIKTPWILSQ